MDFYRSSPGRVFFDLAGDCFWREGMFSFLMGFNLQRMMEIGSRRASCHMILLMAILLGGGCSREVAEQSLLTDPVLLHQYRQESITAIVSVSETNITSSGTLQLTLDVHAPLGVDVVFPEVESLVEPFTVSGVRTEPLQTLPNGKQQHRRVWALIPALPGETVFPSLEIHAGTTRITTDPIAISVSSLLPPGLEVFEIKDIAAPLPLLPEGARKRRVWKILFAGMGVAAGLIFLICHFRKPKLFIVAPPHETAFQALETLPENPLEKIQALTKILIDYLDGRFELPTSGKTIPEIIPLLPGSILQGRHRTLETYLETSEQIRFSNKIPAGFAAEFKKYICAFIEETTQEAPCD